MNRYLDIAPEVQEALANGKPVVALESTIISHGMPYPQNVETALNVEKIIREGGAVPATIAIIGGRLKAGLTPEEIDYLGKTGAGVTKASRRAGLLHGPRQNAGGGSPSGYRCRRAGLHLTRDDPPRHELGEHPIYS